jgi:D-alanyl-lipoteichoic acid acyltransferase DltB (MBOAT superfamily)
MAWKWEFAVLMLAVSAVNFYTGKKISETAQKKEKKLWLALALALSLAPLIYYKYANFFIDNFIELLTFWGVKGSFSYLNVILPVGISFFTFQALSYSLDIYKKKAEVENNFINFVTFVAFFPQLVAGPIERSSHLLSQFREKHNFSSVLFMEGTKLFIWGLFKKVVIADRLSIYVDNIYNHPELHTGSTLAVATLFFAIQIYCDFSGYSDMAIGSARILGFRLMQNFNLPYLASSIGDFWKRWHISLSSWFGDYLYIPLGGNRVSYFRWVLNIFIVFLVSGFWHGANWTFIVWGGLHALYYLFENWGNKLLHILALNQIKKTGAYRVFKVVSVFVLVCFAWIYFRANSIGDAFYISEKIISNIQSPLYKGSSMVTFSLSILLIFFLFVVQLSQYFSISSLYFSKPKTHPALQFTWYVALLLGISLFGMSSSAFIYFQF